MRYITATFEEHYNTESSKEFTVNDSNMSIVPETEWQLKGMYNSFAYIDEYFTALLNRVLEADTDTGKESRYRKFNQ